MSKEEALRMLEQMKDDEKDLQKKLKKKEMKGKRGKVKKRW